MKYTAQVNDGRGLCLNKLVIIVAALMTSVQICEKDKKEVSVGTGDMIHASGG